MRKLLANLKPYKLQVIVMVLILMIQAYCDLALPEYTQNIIDVGIQNKGIEHILPAKITQEDYRFVTQFMTDQERKLWDNSYTDDGDSFQRKGLEEERLEELDEALLIPVVLAYQSETATEKGAESADLNAARTALEQSLEATGTQTAHAMGAAYAAVACERAGIDVNAGQMQYLWHEGFLMLLMTLLMFAAAAAVSFIAARVGAKIGRDLRSRLFRSVMSFSNTEMDQFSTASLITRCTNDVQQVQMVTTMLLRMVTFAPIIGIMGIVKVIQTGASMGWIIVLAVLMILALVALLFAATMPKFRIMQTLIDALNLVSREILTGLPVIRAFGREKEEEHRFDKANTDLMRTQLFTNRVMSLMQPSMMMIMYATTVLITWVSARHIDNGELQVGAMTAFITYSMMIVFSFLIITVMSILIPRAGVAAERIDEVLRTDSSIQEAADAAALPEDGREANGVITFDHVCFRYPGAERDCLSDISFTAEPGKTTAIIGSTGAGKTTLINLIPRFYDVTAGSVRVGGTDVRKLQLNSLRKEIGLVPQKGVLFSGTIATNLRFGAEEATDAEIADAAATAQATEFIDENEDRIDRAIAQGGSNVSGGQKQRLAIARAIAGHPQILIFDDSFSALDMKTDARLRAALADAVQHATVLIVAQRISTILHADQILVMDDGHIAGIGTHEELMKTCEVYQQIAHSQLSQAELEAI